MKELFHKVLVEHLYDGLYYVDRERKILYWNRAAEELTGYRSQEVVGSYCYDNILRHVDHEGRELCKGMCPLAQTLEDGEKREAEVYLYHKKGYRVPVWIRIVPVRNQWGAVVGAVEIFSDNSARLSLLERLKELEETAFVDPLTGVANRRLTQMRLEERLQEFKRYGWPFGVLMADIDHFKEVNDTFGHEVGDRVLRMVAQTMVRCSRIFDLVGRWGGEEFLVIVSNVDRERLMRASERFRLLVASSGVELKDGRVVKVTISLGGTVAQFGDDVKELVRRADRLLYQSKSMGRNRSTVA